MSELPKIYTAKLVSHNAEKGFYFLSDGAQRFFCPSHLFPNGLEKNTLVSFTCCPPNPGKRFPRVNKILFEQETKLEKA